MTQNEIIFQNNPTTKSLKFFGSKLHTLIEKQGFEDINLNFSRIHSLFPNFMLPFIALCRKYRANGVDFYIIDSFDKKITSLFHNTNWAFLINDKYEKTTYKDRVHVPAISFRDGHEQGQAVDKIIETILGQTADLTRESLKALEWSINEITDNVLNHSESGLGGLVQASFYSSINHVEFVVSDAGIGIPRSLNMTSDHDEALQYAIQEYNTRDKNTNQGTGLYGSYRVAALSGGIFELVSGKACLSVNGINNIQFEKNDTNHYFEGTSVSARIDCSKPELIEDALKFGGKIHDPCNDYIESHYAGNIDGTYNFILKDECPSFGNREHGKTTFNKIKKILSGSMESKIIIDFLGVTIISSSFSDESFAKLFIHLGPMGFMNRIKFINIDKTTF